MPDHARPPRAQAQPDAPDAAVDRRVEDAVRAACARHGDDPAALIEILHDLQAGLGHVPEAAVPALALALNLGRAEVHGVLTFYHDFRTRPEGRVEALICRAEACQAMGADALIATLCARRGAALGETDAAGATLKPVYCLGNCALSPAARVAGKLIGRATPERVEAAIEAALLAEHVR